MTNTTENDWPVLTLKACGAVGLFIHYDEARADEMRECMEADELKFELNPPRAAHLAQPGKVIFAFGRWHPRVLAKRLEAVGETVVIDPDVVITEDLYHPPVRQLLSLGEVRRDEKRDYVALGISSNDAPALIRMATDEQLRGGPQDSRVVSAPVHAWRALTQLGAEQAIAPLVELFRRVDDDIDDWVSGDLPECLAEFGAAALAPATNFLASATNGDWSRIAAANTISEAGVKHSDLRPDAIGRLSTQLEHFSEQSETLNGFLISSLMDLRAVEAMPVIERAFASGRVDESIMGDLEDVQIEFGLKTKREHPRKPNKLTKMGEQLRAQWREAGLPLPDADGNFPEDEGAGFDRSLDGFPQPYLAPPKVGRNEPCPCGSGKKYKKCCWK